MFIFLWLKRLQTYVRRQYVEIEENKMAGQNTRLVNTRQRKLKDSCRNRFSSHYFVMSSKDKITEQKPISCTDLSHVARGQK